MTAQPIDGRLPGEFAKDAQDGTLITLMVMITQIMRPPRFLWLAVMFAINVIRFLFRSAFILWIRVICVPFRSAFYSPPKFAFLFSMNALVPSLKSAVPKHLPNSSISRCMPSVPGS